MLCLAGSQEVTEACNLAKLSDKHMITGANMWTTLYFCFWP
jgi:hypothetical protein